MTLSYKRRGQAERLAVEIAAAKRRGVDPARVAQMLSTMDDLIGYWTQRGDDCD